MRDCGDCIDCGYDGLSLVRNFEDRLITFADWSNKVSPEDLASAGFYYTQSEDIVRCAFCLCEFNNWKEDDDPLEDHYKYSNHCEFIKVLWKSRQLKKSNNKLSKREREKNNVRPTYKVPSFCTCAVLVVFVCGLFQTYKTIIELSGEF